MGSTILYRSPSLWLLSSDESFRKILNEAELSDLFFGDSADLESVMSYVTTDISSAADLDDVRAIQLASARSQLLGEKSIVVLLGKSIQDSPAKGRCFVTYIRATPSTKSDISILKIQEVLSKHYPACSLRIKQIEPAASPKLPAASPELSAAPRETPLSREDVQSPSVSLWSFF